MSKRPALFISLLLGAFTFALFWPVSHHDFITYDDGLYVTDNPWVQQGLTLDGVAWAFRTSHASNWHPVTWLSHMLDCSLFDLFPGGHHLTSLLLHVANAILLFLLLKRMTGALWRSGLVAALFAWHPLHVESVAWVAERKDLLSTLFWILTIWAYARYVERPERSRYALALLLFALGLMAKPMVVTLPFVLLLLDYWPLGRTRFGAQRPDEADRPGSMLPAEAGCGGTRQPLTSRDRCLRFLLLEKLPFFALTVGSCLVTVWAQHKGGAMGSLDAAPLSFRLANVLTAYGAYLRKMSWPSDLAVFYPLAGQISVVGAICGGLLLAGLGLFAVSVRRRHPAILVGWLWFLGTLVPVIGLLQVGAQAMADRYTYVPLIGLFISVAWGLDAWNPAWPLVRPLKLAFAGLMLAALALVTGHQLSYWRDGATLFAHAVRVTVPNYLTHTDFGIALAAQGRTPEAIEQFSKALRLNPNAMIARLNLAAGLSKKGDLPEAAIQLREILRRKPDEAAHNNLGILLAKQGQLPEAIEHFNSAIRLKPADLEAQLNLAMALNQQGKTAEAIACYRAALQLQPLSPEPLDKLAWIMATHQEARFRDGPGAVRLAMRATELSRRLRPGYLDTLAAAYAEAGQFKQAIATVQEALQSASNSGETGLTTQIQNRLQLYMAGKPYRDTE